MRDSEFLIWIHTRLIKVHSEHRDSDYMRRLETIAEGLVISEHAADAIGTDPGRWLEEEKDPWKHRSKEMKCFTCIWFVEKVSTTAVDTSKGSFGRCRRHSPSMSGYPAVYGTDWCGDHKLDETKI